MFEPIEINGSDGTGNGLALTDSVQVGRWIADAGLDAIEVSGGPMPMVPKIDAEEKEGYFRPQAKTFKDSLDIPVMLVGGVRSLNVAEKILEDGVADLISMARPFIREPNLINRWQEGDESKTKCISCATGVWWRVDKATALPVTRNGNNRNPQEVFSSVTIYGNLLLSIYFPDFDLYDEDNRLSTPAIPVALTCLIVELILKYAFHLRAYRLHICAISCARDLFPIPLVPAIWSKNKLFFSLCLIFKCIHPFELAG